MTDDELFGCFAIEYGQDGYPVFEDDRQAMPSEKAMFKRHCYLNCITDPKKVEALWQAEQAKRKKNGQRTR